jgi:hypothetical protein
MGVKWSREARTSVSKVLASPSMGLVPARAFS